IGLPGVDGPPIMPEDLYAYIMAAYEVHHRQTTYLALSHCMLLPHLTAESPGYIPESVPEEDPADYSADRDDDDGEEEEEEHPAPVDSVPPVHRMTARISIRDEPSISLPPREEVERLPVTPPKIGRQRNSNIGVLLQGTKHKSRKTTSKETFYKISHSI
ncbi:hypothetical protein Tco_0235111, partial [Tanacetum coccineum]